MDRSKLIDELDWIYEKLCRRGLEDNAEDILTNNNASEDDSDPDEGFMVTMSNKDIQTAIREMKQAYSLIEPDSVQSMVYALQSGTQDLSPDYCEGYLDACRAIVQEYGISIEGLDN